MLEPIEFSFLLKSFVPINHISATLVKHSAIKIFTFTNWLTQGERWKLERGFSSSQLPFQIISDKMFKVGNK